MIVPWLALLLLTQSDPRPGELPTNLARRSALLGLDRDLIDVADVYLAIEAAQADEGAAALLPSLCARWEQMVGCYAAIVGELPAPGGPFQIDIDVSGEQTIAAEAAASAGFGACVERKLAGWRWPEGAAGGLLITGRAYALPPGSPPPDTTSACPLKPWRVTGFAPPPPPDPLGGQPQPSDADGPHHPDHQR